MELLKYLLIVLATSSLATAQSSYNSITGTPIDAIESHELPNTFAAVIEPNQDAATVLQIQQTLSLYAFLIDGKQFEKLDMVFHENVWANYSSLIGIFHPLYVLKAGLQRSIAAVTTQHALATQMVDVAKNGTTAQSATYFTASHFGTGDFYGQVRTTKMGFYFLVLILRNRLPDACVVIF